MVGNGFVHCIPEVDLSNNFNLSNDAMYAWRYQTSEI
jgi:hypothetical protein